MHHANAAGWADLLGLDHIFDKLVSGLSGLGVLDPYGNKVDYIFRDLFLFYYFFDISPSFGLPKSAHAQTCTFGNVDFARFKATKRPVGRDSVRVAMARQVSCGNPVWMEKFKATFSIYVVVLIQKCLLLWHFSSALLHIIFINYRPLNRGQRPRLTGWAEAEAEVGLFSFLYSPLFFHFVPSNKFDLIPCFRFKLSFYQRHPSHQG